MNPNEEKNSLEQIMQVVDFEIASAKTDITHESFSSLIFNGHIKKYQNQVLDVLTVTDPKDTVAAEQLNVIKGKFETLYGLAAQVDARINPQAAVEDFFDDMKMALYNSDDATTISAPKQEAPTHMNIKFSNDPQRRIFEVYRLLQKFATTPDSVTGTRNFYASMKQIENIATSAASQVGNVSGLQDSINMMVRSARNVYQIMHEKTDDAQLQQVLEADIARYNKALGQ